MQERGVERVVAWFTMTAVEVGRDYWIEIYFEDTANWISS